MIKYLNTKKGDGRLIFSKSIIGLGFHIDFSPAVGQRNKTFTLIIDLLFIRFWWNKYSV